MSRFIVLIALVLALIVCCSNEDSSSPRTRVPIIGHQAKSGDNPSKSQQKQSRLRFNFESLLESEFEKAASTPPPAPEDGFGIAISGDFDAMMRQAPILDPENSRFHEGNAYFWYEQFAKAYAVGLELTSQDFQKMLKKLSATSKSQTAAPIDPMRALTARMKKFTPRNRHDEFALLYTTAYFFDWTRIAEISVEVNEICNRLNDQPSSEALRSSSKELQARANEVRLIIYRPSPSPRDVPRRKAMWQALEKLASQAEMAQGER